MFFSLKRNKSKNQLRKVWKIGFLFLLSFFFFLFLKMFEKYLVADMHNITLDVSSSIFSIPWNHLYLNQIQHENLRRQISSSKEINLTLSPISLLKKKERKKMKFHSFSPYRIIIFWKKVYDSFLQSCFTVGFQNSTWLLRHKK